MAGATGHQQWSSRWTFMLAAVGSAVGLGNIWKFPYEAGEGGGGAFVLVYLAFVFAIGLPCLIAELSLGRRGQLSPIGSMSKIAEEEGRSKLWSLIGWSGVLGGFIVLSFYSVVGGWVLYYIVEAFTGFEGYDAAKSGATFTAFITDPTKPIIAHAAFLFITLGIVARGVQGGLEKAVTFLMPALFVLLLGLMIYSGITADFGAAVNFLFSPDFSKLTGDKVLQALGLSFFSLSLALGSIMTYGSYLTKDINITRSAFTIATADSAVALMAGLAIFPIVFAYDLNPGQSVGLVFTTLPIAFGQMPSIVAILFFFLLTVAAVTSAISLLEPAVAYVEERTGIDRKKVAIIIGLAAFVLGTLSAWGQSGNLLGDVKLFGLDIMSIKDYLTNNIMMPLGGMFIAIFVGWFASRKNMMEELAMEDSTFKIWYFLVRFVCPVAIGAVFVSLII
ncbi:sodium-dependent transporter [Kordiimonas sp. SCSIO 12603]|uniref:sodium-dependent transporter n=1 Tax=Kordiimonas sp. SCSIO 12603 TaxID=2829596 RepID=UPI00210524A9|nr:sodium-dependent transporter [Kordiimonas sp. SCSIO 12603]UTW58606.1 sodium-dependent transporter [Kordiimonas sp. SCSIO 12603]